MLLTFLWVAAPPVTASEWHYQGAERIVVLSDIHGAYDPLLDTLQEAGVIDENLAWSGGETHLVITGDLLDRGADSRRVMDIVMRLESEAPHAGGRVHLTLGNHEVMNLIGDLRYVADAEFAAFADEESPAERDQWYQHFRQGYPADTDEEALRAAFNKKAPPGYFGHRQAFGLDGAYGKWLLSKPLMIVINDTAFVHGGVPPFVAEHGLAGVNNGLKSELLDYLEARATLEDAGIVSPIDQFKEQPEKLASLFEAGQLGDEFVPPAKTVAEHPKSPLHTQEGPLWYRGSSYCDALVEADGLVAALDLVGATRAAIGHSTTKSRRVQQRLDGRILEVNTGILASVYRGRGYALIIDGDTLSVASENGEKGLLPLVPPRRVGYESTTVDDDVLERILAEGVITDSSASVTASQMFEVTVGGTTVHARFDTLPDKKGFAPELAAYRLDRLLGLNMIPATVRREIDGVRGTLQFVPPAAFSEQVRVAGRVDEQPPCSLEKQWGAMHVFDALINNPMRTPLTMLYDTDGLGLILVDHGAAFGSSTGQPTYLENVDLAVGERWRTALLGLDDKTLKKNLGDTLDRRRLSALAERRDILANKPQ